MRFFQGIGVRTSQQVREIDRDAIDRIGLTSLVLMENAGRGCAEAIHQHAKVDYRALVLCGAGNNGGDGLVLARHLELLGWEVDRWMIAERERLSVETEANVRILESSGERLHWLKDLCDGWSPLTLALRKAPCLIDALLGTGASGSLRPPLDRVISMANATENWRVAIDLPTGLDADTGIPSNPCFQAALTLTLLAPKPGLLEPTAYPYVGKLEVVGIGVPKSLLVQRDLLEASNKSNPYRF